MNYEAVSNEHLFTTKGHYPQDIKRYLDSGVKMLRS